MAATALIRPREWEHPYAEGMKKKKKKKKQKTKKKKKTRTEKTV